MVNIDKVPLKDKDHASRFNGDYLGQSKVWYIKPNEGSPLSVLLEKLDININA